MAKNIDIGGRLHSLATEHVVAGADEILDDNIGDTQAQINYNVNNTLEIHRDLIGSLNSQNYKSYSANEDTTDIHTILPNEGAVNTVYRLGNWDGNDNQHDATQYSEYAWSNNDYVLLDVKNYGIDDEPNAESDNLVKSRGIANMYGSYTENPEYVYAQTDNEDKILYGVKSDGDFYFGAGVPSQIEEAINELGNTKVDKVSGKQLSTEDYTTAEKTKLGALPTNADLGTALNGKVDKETGKSLIDSEFATSQEVVTNPEYLQVTTDAEGKILEAIKPDGSKYISVNEEIEGSLSVGGNTIKDVENARWVQVTTDTNNKVICGRDKTGILYEKIGINTKDITIGGDVVYEKDIPEQVKDYVKENVPEIEHDVIPYNDFISVGSKVIKIYNPYKEQHQSQFTGQMHFHSWTKFNNDEYPSGFPGEKWKVPYGYSIAAIPSGETDTEKYLWNMPHEKRVAILNALAMAYIWRHKKLGYDFVALSDYAEFRDVTHKPNLSDITYLQTEYPDAYNYFESLYLDGFDVNDFDADGNLKNFCWLCDSYESVTTTLGIQQHIVVHGSPNFAEPYFSGTFNDVLTRVEDYGCVVDWPHPTDADTFATPEVIATVKKRLRLIEIYDGISIRKYDQNGDMTNREYVVSGVMLDEPFDKFLKQGNFLFGMAISDERPTYGRNGENMYILNPQDNLKNGCVKVFCEELTSKSIFESILSGNFYASSHSDASINSVYIEDNKYIVDVGEENVVVEFLKENNTIIKTFTTSNNNTIASYDIVGDEKYVRARVYKLNELPYNDDYWYENKEWMIWTQPVFLSSKIL